MQPSQRTVIIYNVKMQQWLICEDLEKDANSLLRFLKGHEEVSKDYKAPSSEQRCFRNKVVLRQL